MSITGTYSKINRIKILFYHSTVDYKFASLKELKEVVQNIKYINNNSQYIPEITVIGNEFWMRFKLDSDNDYINMEDKLAQTYQLK